MNNLSAKFWETVVLIIFDVNWYSVVSVMLLSGGLIGMLRTIRKIKKSSAEKQKEIMLLRSIVMSLEGDLDKMSTKNEWLTAEMHHRVKNNLQILSSLINSQLFFVDNSACRDILLHSKHRLYALSLVHQKLFQHATAAEIEMSCCIKEVIDYLAAEFDCHERIHFDLHLTSIKVDAATAIPFALIINELVTNSLKYAFPDNRHGNIFVSLVSPGDGNYRLTFSDDGVGLPKGFDFFSAKSLGKTLIMGLSRQIKGHVILNEGSGFKVVIEFKTKIVQRSPLLPDDE